MRANAKNVPIEYETYLDSVLNDFSIFDFIDDELPGWTETIHENHEDNPQDQEFKTRRHDRVVNVYQKYLHVMDVIGRMET